MCISTRTESPRALSVKFLLFFAVLFLLAMPSQAQQLGIDLDALPKLKQNTLLPEAQFNAATKLLSEKAPYNEPRISYSLRVPKNWTDNIQQAAETKDIVPSDKTMLSTSVLGIIGRYVGAPKNLLRSYIMIEAQSLDYEISAQNWFVNFILRNGFSLTALTEKSPQEVEAMYVQVDKDQTFVVRARIMLNGSSLLVLRYYLPAENYEEERALQEQIVGSFRLLQPVNERVEKQALYGFLDQSYFNYPESWTLKEKSIFSVERMSALLYQARNDETKTILEGHFKINVISRLLKTTLADEIKNFKDTLKIPNYAVGALIEDVKYDYDPSIKSGRAQIYKLVPTDSVNMKDYEFVVTVMEGDDYYYITSMITPSRQEDFYTWAQNMEAARIINESMRRSNVAMPGYDPNDPYFDYLKEAPTGAAPPTTGKP